MEKTMFKFRFILLFIVILTIVGWFDWFNAKQSPTNDTSEITRAEKNVSVVSQTTDTKQSIQNFKVQSTESKMNGLTQQVQAQQIELRQLAEQISQIFLVLEEQSKLVEEASVSNNNFETLSDESQEIKKGEHSSLLDEEIDNQFVDLEWSVAAVDQITTILAEATFSGSTVMNANCQETLCRIETDHEDEAALDNFMDNFPTLLGWTSHEHTEIINNSDGTITTLVHISRDGHELPHSKS